MLSLKKKLDKRKVEEGKMGVGAALSARAAKHSKHQIKDKERKRKHNTLDSSEDSEGQVFQKGTPRLESGIQTLHREKTGELYHRGLAEVDRYMRSRGVPNSEGVDLPPRLVGYLTTILHGQNLKSLHPDLMRELRTLAESLDAISEGDLGTAVDLMMQRFKSREQLALTGDDALAKHLELIPPADAGLVTAGERAMAAKAQYHEAKILEIQHKAKKH